MVIMGVVVGGVVVEGVVAGGVDMDLPISYAGRHMDCLPIITSY